MCVCERERECIYNLKITWYDERERERERERDRERVEREYVDII